MRIAIIDLGTNTFNLLIAEISKKNKIKTIFETKLAVKLGEGGINKGFIAMEAFQRGISALKIHKQTIENKKAEKIVAFATSAIRGAENKNDFLQKAKEETGIEIKIISGDKEAEFIYYGVRSAVSMNEETSLIMDIGGGSTEFIIANKKEILWKQSFLLGASRLLQLLNPSDPITDDEIETVTNYLSKALKPLKDAILKFPVAELIGSSGSFDSLAEMIAHKFYTPEILENKTEYDFDLEQCDVIYKQVLKSTKAERTQMKGLIKMRVDMFVISSILVHYIITTFEIKKMRLSAFSLKEGVLQEIINSKL